MKYHSSYYFCMQCKPWVQRCKLFMRNKLMSYTFSIDSIYGVSAAVSTWKQIEIP